MTNDVMTALSLIAWIVWSALSLIVLSVAIAMRRQVTRAVTVWSSAVIVAIVVTESVMALVLHQGVHLMLAFVTMVAAVPRCNNALHCLTLEMMIAGRLETHARHRRHVIAMIEMVAGLMLQVAHQGPLFA